MTTEVDRLRQQLDDAKEAMYDAQDSLSLERAEHEQLVKTNLAALSKKDEAFKTQLTFKSQELERQKQANRKLERQIQSLRAKTVSNQQNLHSNDRTTASSSSSSSDSSSLPAVTKQFPNRKRKNTKTAQAWPKPGDNRNHKKGKTNGPVAINAPPPTATRSSSASSSAAPTATAATTATPTTATTLVRTNHMWAQQREASRALTGHLSGDVKILLGAAGYVEANAVASASGRSNILWSRGMTGGRSSRSTATTTANSSSSSSSNTTNHNSIGCRSRTARLARDLRDGADALYKCLMDLLAGQEREMEATGAPLFAMTAAALRFLCIQGAKGHVTLLPQPIEEAALNVARLLIATTYKRGSRDVVQSGEVRSEDVADQLCLTMHVAVTKIRRGGDAGVVERALGLLNVVMSIDMGSATSKENTQLLYEMKRLVSGRTTGESWASRFNVGGTELVNLVCQLGSQGNVFMKLEGVRALVVAVSKSVFREREVGFLWRQINIVRMMVRLVGMVGDREFWTLLQKGGDGGGGGGGGGGESYPLLGDMIGLLKRKIQEQAGLVRREESLWNGGGVGGVGSGRSSKMNREDRENAACLETLVILEGLKMLETVEVFGNRVGTKTGTRLGGRLGEETAGLYKMAKEQGMTTHLRTSRN